MSRQVIFVVAVDIDTQEVFIDDETLVARFTRDEQVWNTDTNQWECDDDESTLYGQALEILNTKPIARDGN